MICITPGLKGDKNDLSKYHLVQSGAYAMSARHEHCSCIDLVDAFPSMSRGFTMRELTPNEVEQVSGGLLWLAVLPFIAYSCATTQPLRRGEKPNGE